MDLETGYLGALPDAFLVVQDDHVRWASEGAGRLVGEPAGSLAGRALDEILAPGELARLTVLEAQRETGFVLPESIRVRFRRAGSEPVTTDLHFAVVSEGGRRTLVLAARDATAIERAERLQQRLAEVGADEAALVSADAFLDATEPIFEALGWRVAFTEILENGSITRRMLAAPEGDPVGDYGRSIVDRFLPFEKTPVLAEVVRLGRGLFLDNLPSTLGPTLARAEALDHSLAGAHLLRSAWCPVHGDGRITHLLAVTGADLTEHDFAAMQLLAAQVGDALRLGRLKQTLVHHERLAALGEMAAVVAHEVRNPLAVVTNAVDGLRLRPHPDPNAAALVDLLADAVERLRQLATDLLDLARSTPAAGRPVPIAAAIETAIDAASHDPTVRDKRVEQRLDLPGVEVSVVADPDALHRALVNTLVNALVHVPEGGAVSVTARPEGDGEIHVVIHNDGEPIPPEVAPRIFEPFFTTRAGGTGLGLPVVRRIVESFGGRVELDPAETGVTLSLWLRAAPAPG